MIKKIKTINWGGIVGVALGCWKLGDKAEGWSWCCCIATSFSFPKVVLFQFLSFLDGICGIMATPLTLGRLLSCHLPAGRWASCCCWCWSAGDFRKQSTCRWQSRNIMWLLEAPHCALLGGVWENVICLLPPVVVDEKHYKTINLWASGENQCKEMSGCLSPQQCDVHTTSDFIQRCGWYQVAAYKQSTFQKQGGGAQIVWFTFLFILLCLLLVPFSRGCSMPTKVCNTQMPLPEVLDVHDDIQKKWFFYNNQPAGGGKEAKITKTINIQMPLSETF